MDTSSYESLSFNSTRAINVAGPVKERSFPSHRHAYGEIIVVGSGDKNIFRVDDRLYSLTSGDIILVWPMETHEIVDANREDCVIVQYSNTLADSLFDFKRIISLYHDLHILCINSHPTLIAELKSIIDKLVIEWSHDTPTREMRCAMYLLEFMSILDEHHEELNAVRVEKTVSLFPEESLTLTEIAMLAGFKSIPSFNRVFADYKNTSPSQYRKAYIRIPERYRT